MPGPNRLSFLPVHSFASSSLTALRRGKIGKEGGSKSSEFNVQFEDKVVLHEMGNEPTKRDFNIMCGCSGHISCGRGIALEVPVDKPFSFSSLLSRLMEIRRMTNQCVDSRQIRIFSMTLSFFACSETQDG